MTTKISVVLPCYNAEKYIREAMLSILHQTHSDLELLVINDGSTDNSLHIIEALAAIDQRVRIISRENRGLIASLNEGIAAASGNYIARMDADDISLPDRLQQQLSYLQQNDLDLVGGAIMRFYPSPEVKERPKFYPQDHDQIIGSLLTIKSRIAHPTVLARRCVFESHTYNPLYQHAEDYGLWLQIALDGRFRLGNLPKIVLRYRLHENQVTTRYPEKNHLAKQQAFMSQLLPLAQQDRALLNALYNLWQSRLYIRRWRGALSLPRYLCLLEAQPFFNAKIKRYILKRAREQLF